MTSAATDCEGKVKKLLQLMLVPDFRFKNDCYLNTLLSHFNGTEDKEFGKELLRLPSVIEWMVKAVDQWERTTPPPTPISTFVLNLVALQSQYEQIFIYYHGRNLYSRLFKMFNTKLKNILPNTKLAYVKILNSLLSHQPGLRWVISNEISKDCLDFCLESETIYIIREGHAFILNVLSRSIDFNESFTNFLVFEIISRLDVPLHEDASKVPEIEFSILAKKLSSTLRLIIYVLDNLLSGTLFKLRDYRVAGLFVHQKQLETLINKLIYVSRDEDFIFDLYSVLFRVYIFNVVVYAKDEIYDQKDLEAIIKSYGAVFNTLINTNQIVNVVRLSHLADQLWNYLKDRLPPAQQRPKKEPLLFQNQLLIFQVLPVCGISFKYCDFNYEAEDDLRDAYIDGFLKIMCEQTIRMGYNYRTVITEQPDGFRTAKLAIMYLMKNIKNFHKNKGIKVFQVFMYTLKDLNIMLQKNPARAELLVTNVAFAIALLEALAAFIEEFQITWRESVESICVTGVTAEFLNQNFWPPRLMVQGLKLIKLTIAKFMSPNLALLIESENDTTMNLLLNMLHSKLFDINWEIRDSALEVIHTMANISNSKYPSFQKMLMNLGIVDLVVTMCLNDTEGFVRSSALKCLHEMIQVQKFWNETLNLHDLPRKMMHLLQNESEAIVRTEAASLMRYIHEYQSFPQEIMPSVYQIMAYAATSDLHWEVKSNALDFWGKVILNHLQDQGFIDGKFPHVTFSKEHRKIVNLTENEIKARLRKVLGKLSENGCLSVLVSAIQDECDLTVSKKSLAKTMKLKSLLIKYNICSSDLIGEIPTSPEPLERTVPLVSTGPLNMLDISNEVIDEILDVSDLNILQSIYNPNYEIEANNTPVQPKLKVVTAEQFISFIEHDINKYVDSRSEWLLRMDSFNSLVDDMLKSTVDDVNSMDCY